uniref:Uncharacterized protein n=1 Tax=viral metagenome TaxID=1070528 RepID=A0A6H1ZXN3_9ZZZZ
MKCPQRIFVVRCGEETGTGYMPECLKEECAWWDDMFKCCDPTGLAHTLERLTDEVAELARQMPYKREV